MVAKAMVIAVKCSPDETWLIHMRHDSFIWDMTRFWLEWSQSSVHSSQKRVMSHMNESCLIWMNHVSYIWFVSLAAMIAKAMMVAVKYTFKSDASHVSYEWVVSEMNESCLIWMSRVSYIWFLFCWFVCLTAMVAKAMVIAVKYAFKSDASHVSYEWVTSHMNESRLIWMSHVSYEWVTSHMNESCLIWMSHVSYEWVMSHMNESRLIWMSHVSYEWVTSHMNESCLIWMSHVSYEWVTSHMNESCLIWMNHVSYEWVMSHMNESRLI